MKRKIFSILCALVLVLSFSLVTAVPVGAVLEPITQTIEFVPSGGATVEWSTVDSALGDYSVELAVDVEPFDTDWAKVRVLFDPVPLSTFTNPTFLAKGVVEASVGNLLPGESGEGIWNHGPYLNILLDTTGDGKQDNMLEGVIASSLSDYNPEEWRQVEGTRYYRGADPVLNSEGDDAELSYWQGEYPEADVVGIRIALGYSSHTEDNQVVHIDGVTMNDTAYDLEPGVINIDTDEGFNTIQDAIDDADTVGGHTITAAAGTYDESVSISTNNLIVKAQNRAVTEGAAENAIVSPASGNGFTVNADEVTIDGFEIADITGSGIWFVGSNNIFQYNLVHDVIAGEFATAWRFGAIASYVSNAFVQGYEGKEYVDYNQILNNTIYNCNGPGISYASGDTVGAVDINVGAVISGNTIYDVCSALYMGAQYNYAIFIMNGRGFTISENNITDFASLDISCQDGDAPDYQHGDHQILDNKKMGHIRIWASGPWAKCDNLTITGNEIFDTSRPGLRLGYRDQLSISESVFSENYIHNNDMGILMGKKVHDNVISNNTIEDNGLGIQVKGDNNQITGNDILSNNEGEGVSHYGIHLTADASGNIINYNNIVGNTEYGVKNEATDEVDATDNYWGNASGPQPDGAVYTSYGDKVSDHVTFEPWLLAEVNIAEVAIGTFPTTYHKTLALKKGWTLVSTDKAVADSAWVGSIMEYKYTPTGGFVSEVTLTDLEPLTALYMKTVGGGGVGINYAEVGPAVIYSKDLEAGWNLISIPIPSTTVDTRDILSPLRYVTIGTQQGVGLTTLVSQEKYNQFSDFFYQATLTDEDWDALEELKLFDGYWANMEAAEIFEVPIP